MVLTVKSFLGCVDLNISCIVLASVRLILSIIVLIILIYRSANHEIEIVNDKNNAENSFQRTKFSFYEFVTDIYFTIAATVLAVNIVVTYWFIRGAIQVGHYSIKKQQPQNKNKEKFVFPQNNPTKMEYYIMTEVISVTLCMHLLTVHLTSIIVAVVECYVLLCSHSLYQECLTNLGSSHEDAVNTTENTAIKMDHVSLEPSPQYNIYEQSAEEPQPQHSKANPFRE